MESSTRGVETHQDQDEQPLREFAPEVLAALNAHRDRLNLHRCPMCGTNGQMKWRSAGIYLWTSGGGKQIFPGLWFAPLQCMACGATIPVDLNIVDGIPEGTPFFDVEEEGSVQTGTPNVSD